MSDAQPNSQSRRHADNDTNPHRGSLHRGERNPPRGDAGNQDGGIESSSSSSSSSSCGEPSGRPHVPPLILPTREQDHPQDPVTLPSAAAREPANTSHNTVNPNPAEREVEAKNRPAAAATGALTVANLLMHIGGGSGPAVRSPLHCPYRAVRGEAVYDPEENIVRIASATPSEEERDRLARERDGSEEQRVPPGLPSFLPTPPSQDEWDATVGSRVREWVVAVEEANSTNEGGRRGLGRLLVVDPDLSPAITFFNNIKQREAADVAAARAAAAAAREAAAATGGASKGARRRTATGERRKTLATAGVGRSQQQQQLLRSVVVHAAAAAVAGPATAVPPSPLAATHQTLSSLNNSNRHGDGRRVPDARWADETWVVVGGNLSSHGPHTASSPNNSRGDFAPIVPTPPPPLPVVSDGDRRRSGEGGDGALVNGERQRWITGHGVPQRQHLVISATAATPPPPVGGQQQQQQQQQQPQQQGHPAALANAFYGDSDHPRRLLSVSSHSPVTPVSTAPTPAVGFAVFHSPAASATTPALAASTAAPTSLPDGSRNGPSHAAVGLNNCASIHPQLTFPASGSGPHVQFPPMPTTSTTLPARTPTQQQFLNQQRSRQYSTLSAPTAAAAAIPFAEAAAATSAVDHYSHKSRNHASGEGADVAGEPAAAAMTSDTLAAQTAFSPALPQFPRFVVGTTTASAGQRQKSLRQQQHPLFLNSSSLLQGGTHGSGAFGQLPGYSLWPTCNNSTSSTPMNLAVTSTIPGEGLPAYSPYGSFRTNDPNAHNNNSRNNSANDASHGNAKDGEAARSIGLSSGVYDPLTSDGHGRRFPSSTTAAGAVPGTMTSHSRFSTPTTPYSGAQHGHNPKGNTLHGGGSAVRPPSISLTAAATPANATSTPTLSSANNNNNNDPHSRNMAMSANMSLYELGMVSTPCASYTCQSRLRGNVSSSDDPRVVRSAPLLGWAGNRPNSPTSRYQDNGDVAGPPVICGVSGGAGNGNSKCMSPANSVDPCTPLQDNAERANTTSGEHRSLMQTPMRGPSGTEANPLDNGSGSYSPKPPPPHDRLRSIVGGKDGIYLSSLSHMLQQQQQVFSASVLNNSNSSQPHVPSFSASPDRLPQLCAATSPIPLAPASPSSLVVCGRHTQQPSSLPLPNLVSTSANNTNSNTSANLQNSLGAMNHNVSLSPNESRSFTINNNNNTSGSSNTNSGIRQCAAHEDTSSSSFLLSRFHQQLQQQRYAYQPLAATDTAVLLCRPHTACDARNSGSPFSPSNNSISGCFPSKPPLRTRLRAGSDVCGLGSQAAACCWGGAEGGADAGDKALQSRRDFEKCEGGENQATPPVARPTPPAALANSGASGNLNNSRNQQFPVYRSCKNTDTTPNSNTLGQSNSMGNSANMPTASAKEKGEPTQGPELLTCSLR